MFLSKILIFLGIYLFYTPYSQGAAGDRLCQLLNYACGGGGSGGSTSHSYPASSDSHGTNPASIPTQKTPFGIEFLGGQGELNYGFFQGYGKFGLAAGSISKKNAFFSNASNVAAANVELPGGTGGDLNDSNNNFGLAFPLFKKQLKKWMVPYLGLGVRRYKESGHVRGFYGLAMASDRFHLGCGIAFNDENTVVGSFSGGFRFSQLSLDYTVIKNWEGIDNKTDIYSLIYMWKKVNLIVALRKQNIQPLSVTDLRIISDAGKKIQEKHLFLGLQYHLGRMLSVGYYINYVLEKGGYIGLRVTLGTY